MLGKKLKKLPLLTGNAFGFIGNRLYAAYRRQCEFMVEEGAWPEQVDAALTAFGFAMGPFAVADLSGLDIAWRMRQAQAATRDPAARYVQLRRPAVRGRAPRPQDERRLLPIQTKAASAQVDETVHEVIARARADKGIVRALAWGTTRSGAGRCCRMVNEAALLLAEGVAEHATDVDVVLVNGYGFPRWEGGPVFWARERGAVALGADLDWLAQCSGPGFVRGDMRHVLA